ncbi:KN motif and ankyrin repeat domain-containing protein 1 [Oryzias melastigma]|uniref:KN motif and ankyrin repeat domain-containing protein 1 n=1 Tax=Oryzias melastigma TaxID=30732 RepID=A0A834FB05_ORYME|nr:KN motif and ankyrin repeat domain-containing protein 1 [Oryzias melastigma]
MAQTAQGKGSSPGAASGGGEEEKDSYYVETPYGYQLDLDFLKYVEDIERGNTIKKLSIQRKPRASRTPPGPRGAPRAEWTSTDSLSSSNSDDKQSPLPFPSRPADGPPLTPTLSRATCDAPFHQLPPGAVEQRLLPPPSPRFTPRHNSQVEKTLMETRRRLEQERLLLQPHTEALMPRRRLASFGGVGSSSSLSSYSGSVGPSQAPPTNGHLSNGDYGAYFPPSVGSSIRHSPLSSGVATPVTNVSPLHLQQIREQMVVALRRLKELEEQVKTIPILQVKIAVLQEEKRQLAAQAKSPAPTGFRKRSYSVGSAAQMENAAGYKEAELHIMEPEAQEQLDELRRLTAEVQALEKTTKRSGGTEATLPLEAVGGATDTQLKETPERTCRDVGVSTERLQTQSLGVGVTEAMLGVTSEAETEIELQQQTIDALKDKIYRLEVQLKETTHQMEMGKLKLELHAAGGSTRKKADKGLMVRPEVYSVCVEAKVQLRSQGVGGDLQLAKDPETPAVGGARLPSTQTVSAGPQTPMDQWVVRERVQVHDKCVGRRVETCHQLVGAELSVCEVGVNTEAESRSVGCGDGLVEIPVKTFVSRGTEAVPVGRTDSAVMAAPRSASQQTNTETQVAAKSTNTNTPALTDSSTDTPLSTCDKHTNTPPTETRTVAAGEGLVKDSLSTAKMRSVAVGTVSDAPANPPSAKTKECGVGPLSISDNFLIGLKTRSIACGSASPVEPAKSEAAAPLGGVGLDHYIERVQKLLQEQQELLAENYSELAEAFGQPHLQFESLNSQLASTLSSINSVIKYGNAEDILKLQADPGSEGALLLSALQTDSSAVQTAADASPQQQMSAAEQKRCMDLQMSTALHGQPSAHNTLKSIMKKKDGRPESNGTKKNLQFVGVNGGYETTSSDESSSDDSSSSGSDDEEGDEEEEETVGGKGEELQTEGGEEEEQKEDEERSEKKESYELSEKMAAACGVLRAHLDDPNAVSGKELRACINTLQHEWFRVSSQKAALSVMVDDFLRQFQAVSPAVLRYIVNMADGNGNTALHYSVSHSNFQVVKKLLDADVCNVNQQNKAGYTPIMLAALAAVETPKDMSVVEELFGKGDVNARASQAGQTGLMLAVSHGRMDMVRALLAHGADVNVQDDEGSTALMCASEHGHVEIVKLLLAQPGCDATLSDGVSSTGAAAPPAV